MYILGTIVFLMNYFVNNGSFNFISSFDMTVWYIFIILSFFNVKKKIVFKGIDFT